MDWPSVEEIVNADQLQLGKWMRFLPSPVSTAQDELNRMIMDRFDKWTPELSKAVGWEEP